MTKLQELILEAKKLRQENGADFAEYKTDLSKMPAEVSERIEKKLTRLAEITPECERLEKLEAAAAENDQAIDGFKHHSTDSTKGDHEHESKSQKFALEEKRIMKLPRMAAMKNFKDRAGEAAEVKSYRFANWFVATVVKGALASQGVYDNALVAKSEKYCQEFNIKAHSEGTNTAGGYLVPPEFANDIIDLREQYGVFRRFAKVVPMMSDTKSIPRRASGLTVYSPGEGVAITESSKGWDMIQLTAKKFACLALYSSELDEDAMINIGDDLAGEIAYAFGNKEDQCGFNGDGTSTYFGINGVRNKLFSVDGTIANIAGLKVATGNAYSEIVLSDFNGVVGLLPQYAETPRAGWFMSKFFWATIAQKLALAAGGVTASEIIGGARTPTFLGYPVNISQVLPKSEANSQVACLLGDLSLAATFGDRRNMTLAYSTDYKFAEDQLAIRGTQRIDINVHDVGDNGGATGNPGPIVGLIMAAS